jgi:hypothetical protein
VSNLTGGLLNSGSLLEGNNAACFAFQFAAQAKPDVVLAPLTQLTNALGDVTSQLACPQLQKIDDSELRKFPGYTKSAASS